MTWVEHINVDGEVDPETLRERASEMRTEAMRERFQEFDLDSDGFITQAELTEVLEARARENAEQMFQRWGDDGTGMISEERFLENHQERLIHVNRLRGSRDLSAEDRERIRQARELAREAGREGRERVIELRGERAGRMRVLEQDISRTVDEDGNEVIIIKRTLDNGN
ncbi:hypothetical protein CWE08_01405 [Aliidiomarina iranensis]|uniref:EF-hand domain-containing protein n=2 Tax=Aliidiomarina iranensis TaxID=1434071 RepID=A0A432W2E1_9GAMM|nr:hypothetical protein CWE08_01405 [Aliidiomarina iranensis]